MNGPITILFLCALSSQWLFGVDTVEMKTGERVQGLFKQATAAGVVMEVGGQSLTVPIAKVRAILPGGGSGCR